jgi:hypothetical protein
MRSPPCAEYSLQADKGIAPVRGLQSPEPPGEGEEAGGASATAVGTREPPGEGEEAGGAPATIVEMPRPPEDVDEAGGVPATVVEMSKLPEDVEEAGGARATVADMPELPEDPEGPKHALTAKTVDAEALEARTPAEAEHTAFPVAQVPSQSRSLDPDVATVPLAYLAPFCTVILMAISPWLELQQTGIGDVYLDDVLDKSKAALSTQLKFSHKSHDLGTHVLCMVKVNAQCGLQPHGCHWQQQTISETPSSI